MKYIIYTDNLRYSEQGIVLTNLNTEDCTRGGGRREFGVQWERL